MLYPLEVYYSLDLIPVNQHKVSCFYIYLIFHFFWIQVENLSKRIKQYKGN